MSYKLPVMVEFASTRLLVLSANRNTFDKNRRTILYPLNIDPSLAITDFQILLLHTIPHMRLHRGGDILIKAYYSRSRFLNIIPASTVRRHNKNKTAISPVMSVGIPRPEPLCTCPGWDIMRQRLFPAQLPHGFLGVFLVISRCLCVSMHSLQVLFPVDLLSTVVLHAFFDSSQWGDTSTRGQ
jgi:hypothetical protein